MPRYYCDYCDTYLTHDSPSVRKQHNAGYKHKANVRSYYQQFEEQQTQSLIDQKVKEHLGQAGYQQVGAAFHQHLMQAGQFRPPMPLPLPVPGGVRPLPLPRPGVPPPGYAGPPGVRPPTLTPPGAPPSSYPPPGSGTSMSSVPGAPSNGSSYPNPSGNYPPQAQALSNGATQYSSQQPFRPMPPPASSVPSNYPSSTTAATPPANYST